SGFPWRAPSSEDPSLVDVSTHRRRHAMRTTTTNALTHLAPRRGPTTSRGLALVALLALGAGAGCNRDAPANGSGVDATPAGEGAGGRLIPEHGGVMATSAGFTTEVVAQPDGKLLTYVRGPQGPVLDANVRVTVRDSNGAEKPVAVAWDASASAYVG